MPFWTLDAADSTSMASKCSTRLPDSPMAVERLTARRMAASLCVADDSWSVRLCFCNLQQPARHQVLPARPPNAPTSLHTEQNIAPDSLS